MSTVHKDEKVIWFFRRTKTGRLVPALEGQGWTRQQAAVILPELQAGDYHDPGFDPHPAGDHYVPCVIHYVETEI